MKRTRAIVLMAIDDYYVSLVKVKAGCLPLKND